MWRRFRQWLDTLRQGGQRTETPAACVPDQQGCDFRQEVSPEFGELVQSGTPIPTANVQAPHLDADLTVSERVEREIARLKGEHFMHWVLSSYTKGEGSTYRQEEIGGWEQLTPEQRLEVLGVFVDWRGIDSFDCWERIVREYYGPAPQSERENGLDIEF